MSGLTTRYTDWPKQDYPSGESASLPKEEIVKSFEFAETGAITEKEFDEMATEIIERAVTKPTA